MGRWAYTKVLMREGEKFPGVFATEPSIVDELYDALKQIITTAVWRFYKDYEILGVRYAYFEKLKDLDIPVRLWITKQLCEGGWEPFSAVQSDVTLRKHYEVDTASGDRGHPQPSSNISSQ